MSTYNENMWKVLHYILLESKLPEDLLSLNLYLNIKTTTYTGNSGIDAIIENLKLTKSIIQQNDEWFLTPKGMETFKDLHQKYGS